MDARNLAKITKTHYLLCVGQRGNDASSGFVTNVFGWFITIPWMQAGSVVILTCS